MSSCSVSFALHQRQPCLCHNTTQRKLYTTTTAAYTKLSLLLLQNAHSPSPSHSSPPTHPRLHALRIPPHTLTSRILPPRLWRQRLPAPLHSPGPRRNHNRLHHRDMPRSRVRGAPRAARKNQARRLQVHVEAGHGETRARERYVGDG